MISRLKLPYCILILLFTHSLGHAVRPPYVRINELKYALRSINTITTQDVEFFLDQGAAFLGYSSGIGLTGQKEWDALDLVTRPEFMTTYTPLSEQQRLEQKETRNQIVEVLLQCGADPNFVMLEHWRYYSPLLSALRAQDPNLVQTLLTFGADVNYTDPENGMTLLMGASDNYRSGAPEDLEVFRLLLVHGADIMKTDRQQQTVMDRLQSHLIKPNLSANQRALLQEMISLTNTKLGELRAGLHCHAGEHLPRELFTHVIAPFLYGEVGRALEL